MARDSISHRVRPRVGGLLVAEESILLLHIELPTRSSPVWMPPGGEVEFGETITEALQREFSEETGLSVKPVTLAYVHEFIHKPYHAIEFYFLVKRTGGSMETGTDPEFEPDTQIIREIRFQPFQQLAHLAVEPSFLQRRLADDWRQHRLKETRWIGSTVE